MEHYQNLMTLAGFKGINTDFIPELLPQPDDPLYLTNADNIIIKNGYIEKIRGVNYFNNISSQLGEEGNRRILGVPVYKRVDGTKYLLSVTPTKLYKLTSSDSWVEEGVINNTVNNTRLSYANIEDSFIFTVYDSGVVYKYDNTNLTELLDPLTLKARLLLEWKTFLFLIRTIESGTEYHRRLKYSNPGLITQFDPEDTLDLVGEGRILNARKLGEDIYVYLNDSIQRVFFIDATTGFGSLPVTDEVGITAPQTLTGNEAHFFLSKMGLTVLAPGMQPQSISNKKFNHFLLDSIDPIYYHQAVAKYYPETDLLYIIFPEVGQASNTIQLIYDVKVGELISKKTLTMNSYSTYGELTQDLTGISPDERRQYGLYPIPLFGDNEGFIWEEKPDYYQDGLSIYESEIVLPPFFCKSRDVYKRILQADLLIEKMTDNDIRFSLDISNEINETFTYQYTLTGTGNTGVRRYQLFTDVVGKEFRAKLRDIDNMYGWKIRGLMLRGYYMGLK